MKKSIVFIMLFLLSLAKCIKDKPVIIMGTGLDTAAHRVTGESAAFTTNDAIAFALVQEEPFDVREITARIYRGRTIYELVRVFNEEIPVGPDAKMIEKSIAAWELSAKHGTGDYLLLFMIDNRVVARKNFVIKAPQVQFAPEIPTELDQPHEASEKIDSMTTEKAPEKNLPPAQ